MAFDNEKKLILSEKAKTLLDEERKIAEKRKDYTGNRYDTDMTKETNTDEED